MKLAALTAAALGAFATFDSPVVQVRDLAKEPTIAIVAWGAANSQYGLRTRLDRNGEDIGAARHGEHRLYVDPALVDARGGFALAVTQDGKLLRKTNDERDPDACRFDNVCSPAQTIGLGVPDSWLRSHRDGLVVTFRPHTGQNWTVRLDGSVIGAYLATIDSVSASLKKK